MFYTYAYLNEDGRPYYIGKGRGNRAWKKHENVEMPCQDKILILKTELSEEEAFAHERYMIAVLGRKHDGSGILENRTAGGQGPSGWNWSEDEKERIRNSVMGRKWWNNGRENLHCKHRPGDEWVEGRIVTWDEANRLHKMQESASKQIYKLLHESGLTAYVKNLRQLGADCGSKSGFYRVKDGTRLSYKGWIKVEEVMSYAGATDEDLVIAICKKHDCRMYKITHKDGGIMFSRNLTDLGRQYGSKCGFLRVLNGERASYKGWISVEIWDKSDENK